MSLFPARLVFVAFIGLTGLIIYNALYLQEVRSVTGKAASARPSPAPAPVEEERELAADAATTTGATQPAQVQVQEASTALVTAVQRELGVRGYDVGDKDGVMTPEVTNAILSYERENGLEETGQPTDDLLRHIVLGVSVGDLAEAPPVAMAEPPPDIVKAVQQTLAELGYAPGPVDGVMGQNTHEAIRQFQRDRKIDETGELSSALLQEMERVSGREFAGTF